MGELRQQVLQLWLAEGSLDAAVVAWAFHDGTNGRADGPPDAAPPYPTGVAALHDGWMLLQSPPPPPIPDDSAELSYLHAEFVFERRIEVPT